MGRRAAKGGRPPRAGVAASERFEMRITPAEREAWQAAAGNRSLSEWAREILNDYVGVPNADAP